MWAHLHGDGEHIAGQPRPLQRHAASTTIPKYPYLLHPEAHVTAIVEPNCQWIPVRDKHPLSHVELASCNDEGVLCHWQREVEGCIRTAFVNTPCEHRRFMYTYQQDIGETHRRNKSY